MKPYCLVTGGTRGIGSATVDALTAAGYGVVFCGRDTDAGDRLSAGRDTVHFLKADLSDDGDCRRIADATAEIAGGRLAGLVNNAGMGARGRFEDASAALFDRVIGLNLRGAFLLTLYCLPALRAGKGAVVMISSVAGKVGEEGLALYTASKAGLIGLTRSLALEIGSEVRVNAICPGQIETEMMSGTLAIPGRREALERRIPVGRMGTPEDVADAALWLVSDQSRFVNGAILTVDGGEIAGIRNGPA